jgi:hypothetical protein
VVTRQALVARSAEAGVAADLMIGDPLVVHADDTLRSVASLCAARDHRRTGGRTREPGTTRRSDHRRPPARRPITRPRRGTPPRTPARTTQLDPTMVDPPPDGPTRNVRRARRAHAGRAGDAGRRWGAAPNAPRPARRSASGVGTAASWLPVGECPEVGPMRETAEWPVPPTITTRRHLNRSTRSCSPPGSSSG